MNKPTYKYTLLSAKEYEKHAPVIPEINEPWWLRTPGSYSTTVCFVFNSGHVIYGGGYAFSDAFGVRPALLITNPEAVYNYGSEITVGRHKWTVLRSSKEECYALCTKIVAHRRFDAESNDFEKSEIKHWLDNDFAPFNASTHENDNRFKTETEIFEELLNSDMSGSEGAFEHEMAELLVSKGATFKKYGKWIDRVDIKNQHWYRHSNCPIAPHEEVTSEYPHCPHCGAIML